MFLCRGRGNAERFEESVELVERGDSHEGNSGDGVEVHDAYDEVSSGESKGCEVAALSRNAMVWR